MKRRKHTSTEDEPRDEVIGLIEESVHMLRSCPAWSWVTYLTGTVPFLACLIIFWAEMVNSGLARHHLPAGALAVTASYLWMKCWQTYWILHVRNTVVGDSRRFTLRQRLQIARRQVSLQPWGLIAFPASILLVIPYPWVLAYFQNLTVCEALDPSDDNPVTAKAARFAGVELKQLILFSLLWIKILVVFILLNWLTILALLPYIMLKLFGVDSEFVRSPYALFSNSTFYIVALALTYLTLDPLLKTFFFLRCYYAESLTSGMDIRVRLKRLSNPKMAALTLLILATLLWPQPAIAANADAVGPASPYEGFESAKQEVRLQKKYLWRHSPETIAQDYNLPGWADTLVGYASSAVDSLRDLWKALIETIGDLFMSSDPDRKKSAVTAKTLTDMITAIMVVLVVILALAVAIVFVRSILRRHSAAQAAQPALAVANKPDLSREDVTADALPVQRWLAYAHELAAQGSYRLAIRAVFLGQIALLSEKHLIILANYKSNREYTQELARRSHAFPMAVESFTASSRIFESIWYGDYSSGELQFKELEHQFHQLDGHT